MDASYVDLSDPRHLEFDYLRWFRLVLRGARAHRVLHIGGGACALARALASEDPQGRQEVCEVDANVLELARCHLGLRRMPGLRVRHAEGRAVLRARAGGDFDAVAVDAFVGARVPAGLTTVEAMTDAAAVAALTVVNVVDDRRGEEITAIAAALRTPTHASGRSEAGSATRWWPVTAAGSSSARSPREPRPTPPRPG